MKQRTVRYGNDSCHVTLAAPGGRREGGFAPALTARRLLFLVALLGVGRRAPRGVRLESTDSCRGNTADNCRCGYGNRFHTVTHRGADNRVDARREHTRDCPDIHRSAHGSCWHPRNSTHCGFGDDGQGWRHHRQQRWGAFVHAERGRGGRLLGV